MPVFVALDTPDLAQAQAWTEAVRPHAGGVKLGLEFWNRQGPDGARRIASLGLPVFLDLKFHDIPNTVAGAVRSVLPLRPAILNVHAAGGLAMMRAARDAAAEAGPARPKLIAVTVLTSLSDADLAETGVSGAAGDQALRLAALARTAGLDGVVCSAHEIAAMRARFGADFLLVVPGLRAPGADAGDQKRTMTPAEAQALGADVLVIGRPVTAAPDPRAAAAAIASALA